MQDALNGGSKVFDDETAAAEIEQVDDGEESDDFEDVDDEVGIFFYMLMIMSLDVNYRRKNKLLETSMMRRKKKK